MSDIDPARADYLRNKYVTPPHTLEQSVITAEAEQLSKAVLDTHAACDAYNEQHGLAWLTLDLPIAVRDRIGTYTAKLREAQSRDSLNDGTRNGGAIVRYYDERNSHDEANGWPAFDPYNPHQQNIPFGHIVSDPTTVHVLRGGTEPLFDERDGRGHYQRPADIEDRDDLPDWGHGYDFATFIRTAERRKIVRFCDLRLPDGCAIGIGGGGTRLAAIAFGRHIYMVSLCAACIDALESQFAKAHPKWRVPNPLTQGLNPASRRRRLSGS